MMTEKSDAGVPRRAIILGGGDVAGIPWESGLCVGLLEDDIPLNDADLVIRTSAGSVVGAKLRADGANA